MSSRKKLLLAMLGAASLLAWLSTPHDAPRRIRIVRGMGGTNQPGLPQTACKVCLPAIPMVNIITWEISFADGQAR